MNANPSEEFFRALEIRRARALVERDMATLDELHAPEYQLVTPSGNVLDKKGYLGAIEREPFYAAWDVGAVWSQATEIRPR